MYEGVTVEWVHGAVPTAHFFDQHGYQIKQVQMNNLSKEQIRDFFKSHDFLLTRKKISFNENTTSEWSWGGHHYELFPQRNSISFAKEFASSRSHNGVPGYIAIVSSAEEQRVITDMMSKFDIESVWLDGSDEETEGTWKWMSGDHANTQFFPSKEGVFSSWNKGEPNDANDEDCVLLLKGKVERGVTQYGWNDVSCTDEVSALLIEYGVTPHDSSPFEFIDTSPSQNEELVEEKKEDL